MIYRHYFLKKCARSFITDYEFVEVNEHKSHLLMNCTDFEKLGADMESPFAKEWDKKIIVRIPYMQLSLLDDVIIDRRSKVEGL